MQTHYRQTLTALVLLAVLPARLWALGEEKLGNEPLNDANYVKWPGLAAVVNNKSRVYYNWVNGNENCYYTCNAAELSGLLTHYAAATLKAHEVAVVPGPGKASTFGGESKFEVQCQLQIFGGIAAHMLTLDQGKEVWPAEPRLTIYSGGDLDLTKLEIPKGLVFLTPAELSARIRKGADSKDQSVKGWSAGVLAHNDSFDPANLAVIQKLLADENDWVRLNAAGAVTLFGAQAKIAIPALKGCLERKDEGLKTTAQKSIETIEAAPDRTAAAKEHAEAIAKIEAFVAAQKEAAK
jgi:hypothetical protein